MSLISNIFRPVKKVSIEGITDWHCHVLPGVDDGVSSISHSLDVLDDLERRGVAEMWLTPHIMEDVPNTPDRLRARFDELTAAYEGGIRLNLAAENMIDALFVKRLKERDLLPIGPRGDMLLVETSYYNPPARLDHILSDILSAGYFPLLAHPERYHYIDSHERYAKLREKGVRFQLNLLSLTGFYGEHAKHVSLRLLGDGMYDYAGSDLHHINQAELIDSIKLRPSHHEALSKLLHKP